jgi:hypothetical protein
VIREENDQINAVFRKHLYGLEFQVKAVGIEKRNDGFSAEAGLGDRAICVAIMDLKFVP